MSLDQGITLKPTVIVNGREWHLFAVDFETADGKFATYVYAISREHASHIVEELRNTATLAGQVVGMSRGFK